MVTMPTTRPLVADDLDVNEEKEGLIVYDQTTDRVHYLNSTAAIVFALCDGRHDASEIASFVAAAFKLNDLPLSEIEACLTTLDDEGLLQ
jgi:hypothetical protein